MPTWGWLLLGIVAVLVWMEAARRSWRRMVRREFRAYLEAHVPGITVVREEGSNLLARIDGEEGVINLSNLYGRIAIAKAADFDARKPFYDELVSAAREIRSAGRPFSVEADGDRILPRISPDRPFEGVPADQQPVSRPLPGTPLRTEYVMDSENAVQYINKLSRDELGLDMDALHEIALNNLRTRSSPEAIRQAIEGRGLSMMKMMDTYDAARLLLVPEHLNDGEAVAAVIPDRDTLALAPVPDDGDWSGMVKLANSPASERLIFNRPLRVTRAGFEVM